MKRFASLPLVMMATLQPLWAASPAPQDQLAAAGQGVYFRHDFPRLGLSHKATLSWWHTEESMISTTLHIELVRGNDRLELRVDGYDGAGTYGGDDVIAILHTGGKEYRSDDTLPQSVIVQTAQGDWITGHFSAAVRENGDGNEVRRLEQGIFRLSADRAPAVAAFGLE